MICSVYSENDQYFSGEIHFTQSLENYDLCYFNFLKIFGKTPLKTMRKNLYVPKNYTFVNLKVNQIGTLHEHFILCILKCVRAGAPPPKDNIMFVARPASVPTHTPAQNPIPTCVKMVWWERLH